jgi:hypothetical protein
VTTFRQWLARQGRLSADQLRSALERLNIDVLDKWAFGVVGDQIIKLDPKDITVVHSADLENAQHQARNYKGGANAWAKSVSFKTPVDVSVANPDKFVLEDGHHRYFAASILGRKLSAKVTVKGKPIEELIKRAESLTHRKTTAELDAEIEDALKGRGEIRKRG